LSRATTELENLVGAIVSGGQNTTSTLEIDDFAIQPISMYIKNVIITQSQPMTNATAQAWFNYMQAKNPSDVTTIITGKKVTSVC
jgi:hypothetical protein